MIKKSINFFKAINDWGDYTQRKFVENASQLSYWPQLFMVLIFFGIPWAYAWFGHLFTPCFSVLQPRGFCDPVTPGTVLLRRSWATAVCAPFIIYAIIRFGINRYKMHKESKNSKDD